MLAYCKDMPFELGTNTHHKPTIDAVAMGKNDKTDRDFLYHRRP
jgi:hypothetical protein